MPEINETYILKKNTAMATNTPLLEIKVNNERGPKITPFFPEPITQCVNMTAISESILSASSEEETDLPDSFLRESAH
jgi:hypothetical protein